jgi:hypothetical protein
MRVKALDLCEKLSPVHVGHTHVGDDHIDG